MNAQRVDVLAAFDHDIQVERLIGDERAVEKVRALRDAVAELIEAAQRVSVYPSVGNVGRLGDALARCGVTA